jgi:carboxypeptidase Taq
MVSFSRYAVSSLSFLSYRTSAFTSSRSRISFVRGGATDTRLDSSTTTATETTSKSFFKVSPSYEELVEKLKTITHLQRASAVLGYDQLVFMPQADQTSAERGAQLAALASIIHEQSTSPKLLELIDQSIEDLQATPNKENFKEEARILELERKSFVETNRVPAKLAKKAAELSSAAYAAWAKARKASDFAAFSPVLQDCFDTAMSIADAKRGDDKTKPLYTQMLDEFEMGMPQQRMDDVFQQVQQALVPLIAKVLDSKTPPSTKPLEGTFPLDKQKELSQKIVTSIGFNQEIGRIDVSVHPFTTSFSPSDVRITSRFSEQEWYQGLAGTVHEGTSIIDSTVFVLYSVF